MYAGVGAAPIGWPATIPSDGFVGTTRSKLSSLQITEIIISMLTAVGIDPATYVATDDDLAEEVTEEAMDEVVGNLDNNDNIRADMAIESEI